MDPKRSLQECLNRISTIVGREVVLFYVGRGGDLADEQVYSQITPDKQEDQYTYYPSNNHIYLVGILDADGKIESNITQFKIVPFPGCCGLVISTAAYVYDPYKNRGINKIANLLRQRIAWNAGYTILVCTDVDQNEPERRTLRAMHWRDILQFRNRRTKNLVNITIKDLNYEQYS